MNVCIEAIAYALPAKVLTNDQLRAEHPEWDMDRLEPRTGVLARHIAAEGETALDLAERACDHLAATGKLARETIDAVIFCTETPDHPMPPNACLLHHRLGLRSDVPAFDITLACSGFVYGLQIADSLIKCGVARRVLLATADTYSRLIHPGDRATRCLFGDGGAVSLIGPSPDRRGILDIRCGTSGGKGDRFMVRAGGARLPRSAATAVETTDNSGNVRTAEHIAMNGISVLSFFNTMVPREVDVILRRNRLTADDVDLFIFHQASAAALDGLQRALGLPTNKMVRDMAMIGNLVSASIPVAMQRAIEAGRLRPGQTVVLCGFGVGLSWGTALVLM